MLLASAPPGRCLPLPRKARNPRSAPRRSSSSNSDDAPSASRYLHVSSAPAASFCSVKEDRQLSTPESADRPSYEDPSIDASDVRASDALASMLRFVGDDALGDSSNFSIPVLSIPPAPFSSSTLATAASAAAASRGSTTSCFSMSRFSRDTSIASFRTRIQIRLSSSVGAKTVKDFFG
eukprot:scaffold3350_cov268-Pinguiococcus_pyrenoidosus.AAC.41